MPVRMRALVVLAYLHGISADNTDECVDLTTDGCDGWAEAGECDSNPRFMLVCCRQFELRTQVID